MEGKGEPDLRKWGRLTRDLMNIKGPVVTTRKIEDLFLEAPLLWGAHDVEILSVVVDISKITNTFPWIECALTGIEDEFIYAVRSHPEILLSKDTIREMKIGPSFCDAKSLVELNLLLYDYCPKFTSKYSSIIHAGAVDRFGFQLAPFVEANIYYGCANPANAPALLRALEPLRKLKAVTKIEKLKNL